MNIFIINKILSNLGKKIKFKIIYYTFYTVN